MMGLVPLEGDEETRALSLHHVRLQQEGDSMQTRIGLSQEPNLLAP